MTKHVHAEILKAKADNMELVVFLNSGPEWIEISLQIMVANDDLDFFLCLPQHKEACLHWLNGGKIQYKTELVPEFQDYQPDIEFGLGSIFMQPDFEIRIKPRKEKRWVAVNSSGYVMPIHCGSFESAKQHASHCDSSAVGYLQFIEIEVEV